MASICEINDAGILVLKDEQIVLESPGYIALETKKALVGNAGHARAKLMPTATEYRFWDRLGMEELSHATPLAHTQADLAYLHLSALAEHLREETVLAVPGDLKREQLGLLLGMTRRLNIPVRAILDTAVAQSAVPQPGRRLYHLDCHLHRCILTELHQDAWLTQTAVTTTREVGMARLWEIWLHRIATLFVQTTRFDPMHEAHAEQHLFDHIADWNTTLGQQDFLDIEMSHGERNYTARLHRRQLIEAAQPLYRRLREFIADSLPAGQPATVQLGARAAAAVGLAEELKSLPDLQVVALPWTAANHGLKRLYLDRDRGSGDTPYVKRIPWFSARDASRHDGLLKDYRREPPTHVLHQAIAHPLGHGGFWVGTALAGASGIELNAHASSTVAAQHFCLKNASDSVVLENIGEALTLVNDEPVTAHLEVAVGDRIRIADLSTEFLLITVKANGA